jgi:hypothetical protein
MDEPEEAAGMISMETASARAALNAHAELHLVLNHPSAPLLRSLDHYVTTGQGFAEQQRLLGDAGYEGMTAEERALLKSWDYYVWPARTGRDLTWMLAEPLSSAPTYQVTGEIVRAITSMYQATADGEPVLRASEMPSQTGFAYLDEPITLTDFSGARIVNRALSWGPQTFSPGGIRPVKGTRITSWSEGYLHALRSDTGLGNSSSVFVPYGRTITAGTSDDPTRWLHCLWLFMDTEIAMIARERADRSSRRRAAAA